MGRLFLQNAPVNLAVSVSQTHAGATYTTESTRTEMWADVQRVVEQMKLAEPGTPVLVLPARVGVYHPGTVYTHVRYALQANIQPGGVYVTFTGADPLVESDRRQMADWLTENGYDNAGTPWATLTRNGVAEVRWPVRPVRDNKTFIGRHGLRVGVHDPDGLVRDRQADYRELVGHLKTWRDALDLARLAHLVSPDDVVRWLTLAARAGLAELTCRATGVPMTVELDGRQVEVTAGPGRLDRTDIVSAVMAALAVADPVALALLGDLPNVAAEEYVQTRVTALRALSRGDANARRAVRTVLDSARAMADDNRLGPWFTQLEVPVWRLAMALLDGSNFTTVQRDALLAHRQWWAHTQANPGEPQDLDVNGYLSLGVTCFAALRLRAGGNTVDSEYTPRSVLDASAGLITVPTRRPRAAER
jgi:hypothetical protein